jgi:hypothetical protein
MSGWPSSRNSCAVRTGTISVTAAEPKLPAPKGVPAEIGPPEIEGLQAMSLFL